MIFSKKLGKYSLVAVLSLGLSGCEWTILEGTGPEWDVIFGVSMDNKGHVISTGYTRYFPVESTANKLNTNSVGKLDLTSKRSILDIEEKGLSLSTKVRANAEANEYDVNVMKVDAVSGDVIWSKNFNYSSRDIAYATTTDRQNNIYISGMTLGDFGDTTASCGNDGQYDSFVAKIDKDGDMIWGKMICSTGTSRALDVKVDKRGNVYATGYVNGDLEGQPSMGEYDGYVAKFDKNGNAQYLTQVGGRGDDWVYSLVVDKRNNVYVVGDTTGDLGAPNAGSYDIFVSKLNMRGAVTWTTQYGSNTNDFGAALTFDARESKLYVAGRTRGDLGGSNAGYWDTSLAALNLNGTVTMLKQYGTEQNEVHQDITSTANGKIIIAGMKVNPADHGHDVNVMQISPNGALLSNEVYGAQEDFDYCSAVTNSGYNTIYLGGSSFGNFEGLENAGGHDKFIKHIDLNDNKR